MGLGLLLTLAVDFSVSVSQGSGVKFLGAACTVEAPLVPALEETKGNHPSKHPWAFIPQ